jgi:hypothetical protein
VELRRCVIVLASFAVLTEDFKVKCCLCRIRCLEVTVAAKTFRGRSNLVRSNTRKRDAPVVNKRPIQI